MSPLFPHANIVTAVLVFIVGFCAHWLGQLISVINWDLATRYGLQEKGLPAEYKVYEHAIAVADSLLAWEGNRRRAGHQLWSTLMRIGWCSVNALTGVLALLLAWTGPH
jgi:hypothetical protein